MLLMMPLGLREIVSVSAFLIIKSGLSRWDQTSNITAMPVQDVWSFDGVGWTHFDHDPMRVFKMRHGMHL